MGNELIKANEKNLGTVINSREVAEMCDKRHSDLMRDIRNYIDIIESANLHSQNFFIEGIYQGERREEKCYMLTKKGCDMVANKMTGAKGIIFTAKYVTKFEEMEKQLTQVKLPTTYKEALVALLEEVEKNEQITKQLEIQAPKVEVFDKIIDSSNTYTPTQMAKCYGLSSAMKMNKILNDNKICYKQGKSWHPYHNIDTNWYKEVVNEYGTQLRFTSTGMVELSKLLELPINREEM